jgi:hypothetical protein
MMRITMVIPSPVVREIFKLIPHDPVATCVFWFFKIPLEWSRMCMDEYVYNVRRYIYYIHIHINICAHSLCDCVRNHSMCLSYPKILPKIGWWSICIGRTNPAEPFPAGGRLKLPKQKGWVLKLLYTFNLWVGAFPFDPSLFKPFNDLFFVSSICWNWNQE